jgi:hypothetical protein
VRPVEGRIFSPPLFRQSNVGKKFRASLVACAIRVRRLAITICPRREPAPLIDSTGEVPVGVDRQDLGHPPGPKNPPRMRFFLCQTSTEDRQTAWRHCGNTLVSNRRFCVEVVSIHKGRLFIGSVIYMPLLDKS